MVEGYQRRNRAHGVFFRELYSLVFNVNRGEKTPYLSPADVLALPGDKKPRKKREPKTTAWTPEAIEEAIKKHSALPPTEQST